MNVPPTSTLPCEGGGSQPGIPSPASAQPYTWEAFALVTLMLVVLVSFRDAIFFGRVPFETDTLRFYYPLERWFAEEFKSGRFPLWNPYIFAGYPIFADGEMGLANPIHLLLVRLLPVETAYVWLRVTPVAIAALGMFALCRALGLSPLAALVGGTTFSLGSFLAAQTHHEDMTRSVAWAPMAMACVEWGLRRGGWRRYLLLTGAAGSVAMSALGLHPQGLAIALLAVSSFLAVRILTSLSPPSPSPSTGEGIPLPPPQPSPVEGEGTPAPPPPLRGRVGVGGDTLRTLGRRVALLLWTGGYVFGVGLGLAAVQLLPVAELGTSTFRATQPDYLFATSYALPIPGLVSLFLPYFFRGADSQYWSLWSQWETTVYVGILPLTLGAIGAVTAIRRSGVAIYFLVLAMAGLWLAFASYAPFDLYRLLWELPGFSAFRVPGRYSFLFVLGWSVLAAYGAHALGQHVAVTQRSWIIGASLALLSLLVTSAAALTLANFRATLLADPNRAMEWIESGYLALRHHQEGIAAETVYRGLLHSLDLGTPRTAISLTLLAVSGILVGSATVRGARGRSWQMAAAGVVAVDLLAFVSSLHQRAPVDQLSASSPAIEFLAARAGEGRVFSPFSIPSIEPDRLAPYGIEDLGGYSSLESRQNFSYWAQLTSTQNRLLDMANVKYVVYPTRFSAMPSYLGVPFDPERPLLVGGRGSPGGSETFLFNGIRVHQVRVVAALTHAFTIPQEAVVAEVVVFPRQGSPVVVPLRAGVDLAEWAYDRPDAQGKVVHAKPSAIAFRRPDFDPVTSTPYPLYLFYSEHDLPDEVEVDRVEVRYVHPLGSMEFYGLGLYNATIFHTVGATQQTRSKFRPAYRDGEVQILENTAMFPQAYVVEAAVTAPAGSEGMGTVLYTPFDPATTVLLDGAGAYDWPARSRAAGDADRRLPIAAEVIEEQADLGLYRARAPNGGFLVRTVTAMPGWRAWVDGEERPVLQANYLFQAVPLPPGTHTVEFRYAPSAVRIGLGITIWSACFALAVIGGSLFAARVGRAPRSRNGVT